MAEQARDVICGTAGDPETAGGSTAYGGKTTYLYCAGCSHAFERAPVKRWAIFTPERRRLP